ncbi:MAG: N-acetylmuramoyl-L-alanine amidase [Crocinitomicaceae bacterium]|nr:N-acetylmuramoyl-L-alanine amidase [Crocinitomicaceae bacterium]
MRILALVVLFTFFGFSTTSFAQQREVVVVIDPGHGGEDPGHLSNDPNHLAEKDLNLKIAQFLGGYIEKYLQNVRVIYTRTSDVYPSLDDRVEMANAIEADYFISVHCNGNDRSSVRGTESHVHSMSLTKSVALAREIELQFSSRAGRRSRGVKDERDLQHSLQVLKYTNMTSVLVECGFMTNTREANYLNTTYGQEILASAIFRGFRATIVKEYPMLSFIRTEPVTATTTLASSGTSYAIQIASSKTPVDPEDSSFRKLKMTVERRKLTTTGPYKYIYIVGDYATKKEAKNALISVQENGFRDAIVVKR